MQRPCDLPLHLSLSPTRPGLTVDTNQSIPRTHSNTHVPPGRSPVRRELHRIPQSADADTEDAGAGEGSADAGAAAAVTAAAADARSAPAQAGSAAPRPSTASSCHMPAGGIAVAGGALDRRTTAAVTRKSSKEEPSEVQKPTAAICTTQFDGGHAAQWRQWRQHLTW